MKHSEKLMLPNGLLVTPFKGDNLYEVGNMVFKQYYVRINAAWEAKTKWPVWLHAEPEDMSSIPVISECFFSAGIRPPI